MESPELLALLFRITLAATVAILVVLALRHPLRAAFGANVAYAIWTLPPAMMLAAAFSRELPEGTAPPAMVLLAPIPESGLTPVSAAGGPDAITAVLAIWAAGFLLWLSIRLLAQWRWRRRIGPLRRVGKGMAVAAAEASLPAATGWPRATVVLPSDFEIRFPETERALVLAHEHRHIERGDLHAQVLAELIRALLWFHPLVHWAARRFRHDQELACDADIIACHPRESASYARALARAAGVRPPPIATTWGFSHPLKERIAMLTSSPRSTARQRLGRASVILLLAFASGLAWASLARTPGAPPDNMLRQIWTLTLGGGGKLAPLLLVNAPGVPAEIRFEHEGEAWTLRSAATALADGTFEVDAQVLREGVLMSSPRMTIGESGGSIAINRDVSVDVGSGALDVPKAFMASVRVEAGEGTALAAVVPRYPDGLAKAGVEGRVLLRVSVDASGQATEVRIETSSGNVALDESARSTAYRWRFTPAIKDGAPIAGEVLVPVEFRAEDKAPLGSP